MGHYCTICGRTRANEKFTGKRHMRHVCKDCAGKAGRRLEAMQADGVIRMLAELEDTDRGGLAIW